MIAALEAEIHLVFQNYDESTFIGSTTKYLAGEYFGWATFSAFAVGTKDAEERAFWQAAANIETVMIARLEQLLSGQAAVLPDRLPFTDIGRRTAEVFAGEPHYAYCDWVAPMIEVALSDFEALRLRCQDQEDVDVCLELIAHEKAFVSAWSLLEQGFAAAAGPLIAHVEKFGTRT